jgi:hypothetical protein
MLFLKAAAIWLLILAVAVLNGAFRELALVPGLGKPAALVLSGVLLSACILVISFMLVPRLGPFRTRHYLNIGLLWLVLTVTFEFAFGHLYQGRSWAELFQAYTFTDGNMWPLVLLVTLVAPLLAGRLRRRARQ